jgi:hypothetical protein
VVHLPVSSHRAAAFPPLGQGRHQALLRTATSVRCSISRLQSFASLQASGFACHPGRSHRYDTRSYGGRDVYIRAPQGSLPSLTSDMLAVRIGQLTAGDFHPQDSQPCRLLPQRQRSAAPGSRSEARAEQLSCLSRGSAFQRQTPPGVAQAYDVSPWRSRGSTICACTRSGLPSPLCRPPAGARRTPCALDCRGLRPAYSCTGWSVPEHALPRSCGGLAACRCPDSRGPRRPGQPVAGGSACPTPAGQVTACGYRRGHCRGRCAAAPRVPATPDVSAASCRGHRRAPPGGW